MGPGSRSLRSLVRDDGEFDGHCRQTGAATAASSEMAGVRSARTCPDDAVRRAVFRLLAVGDGRHRDADHRPSVAVAAGGHLHIVHLCDLPRRGRRYPPERSFVSDRDLRGDARHAATDRRNHHPPDRAWGSALPDPIRLSQLPQGLWQFPPAVGHADRLALCRDTSVRRLDSAVHDRTTGQRHS